VGTCDELFQSTVAGRQSSGLDLAADALGAGLAQLFYRALGRG
jgi:VanZ family protein